MKHSNRRSSLGIIMIAFGIIFLLHNLNLITLSVPSYFLKWQLILVVIGLFQTLTGNLRGGSILIIIGITLWIPTYFHLNFKEYWPAILIIIGLSIFLKNRSRKMNTNKESAVDYFTILGSTSQSVDSKEFKGGKANTILGKLELDLRNSSLENGQAIIDTFTAYGSVRVFIPEDWVVNYEVTSVLGSYRDKRAHKPSEYFGNVLTLKGVVVFGGIELVS